MPAPHPEVLKKLMEMYQKYDKISDSTPDDANHQAAKAPEPATNSLANLTKYIGNAAKAAETAIKYAIGSTHVDAQLKELCDDVIRQIENNKQPSDWIATCFNLEEKAKTAQGLKTRWGQSRCCEIFFALKSEILFSLRSADDEYKQHLDNEIKKLTSDRLEFEAQLHDSVNKKNGVGSDVDLDKFLNTLKKLAILEDPMGLYEAYTRNLFPYLLTVKDKEKELGKISSCHMSHNAARPYCMQNDFRLIKYKDSYQQIYCEKYETLMDDIIKKSSPKESNLKDADTQPGAIPPEHTNAPLNTSGNNNNDNPATVIPLAPGASSKDPNKPDDKDDPSQSKNEGSLSTTNGTLFKIPKATNMGGVAPPSTSQQPTQTMKAHK